MYVGRIEKLLAYYTLVPMCIINSSGKVTRANKKIADVFKYDGIIDGDIFALTGIKLPEIVVAAKEGTAAERLSIPARRIAINRFILVILSYSPNAICPGR